MAARDDYRRYGTGNEAPARSAVAITPDNSNDLAIVPRALYIGVSGDVKVDMVDGGTVTFVAASVGEHPWQVLRVYDTGTTATNIIAIW